MCFVGFPQGIRRAELVCLLPHSNHAPRRQPRQKACSQPEKLQHNLPDSVSKQMAHAAGPCSKAWESSDRKRGGIDSMPDI